MEQTEGTQIWSDDLLRSQFTGPQWKVLPFGFEGARAWTRLKESQVWSDEHAKSQLIGRQWKVLPFGLEA